MRLVGSSGLGVGPSTDKSMGNKAERNPNPQTLTLNTEP